VFRILRDFRVLAWFRSRKDKMSQIQFHPCYHLGFSIGYYCQGFPIVLPYSAPVVKLWGDEAVPKSIPGRWRGGSAPSGVNIWGEKGSGGEYTWEVARRGVWGMWRAVPPE